MPAPPGNKNACTHYGHARVSIVGLPKKFQSIRKQAESLRRVLEKAVAEHRGTVRTTDALIIHSAVTHQILMAIWQRRIRDEWDELTTEQQLNVTQMISRETDKRDAAVGKLGLDKAQTQSIKTLYLQQPDEQPESKSDKED